MNELTPKDLYDQKKQEKLASENKEKAIKRTKKFLILILIFVLAFAVSWWLIRRSQKKISETKIHAVEIADQGEEHIAVGAGHPDYNSNPPTSGWHYPEPAPKRVYDKELPDEQLIHNLEHGYVWISFRPDADPEIVKQLKSFAGFGRKIIVEPRSKNDKLVALAAWRWLDKFDPESKEKLNEAELKRIGNFITYFINQGPEPNAP